MERDVLTAACQSLNLHHVVSIMEVASARSTFETQTSLHDIDASQHQESLVKVSSSIFLDFTPQLHTQRLQTFISSV